MAREVLLLSEARIATVQLIEQMLDHLSGTTGLGSRSRLLGELQPDDITPGTFPLFLRASNITADRLARDLRAAGVAYGYYLDDNPTRSSACRSSPRRRRAANCSNWAR